MLLALTLVAAACGGTDNTADGDEGGNDTEETEGGDDAEGGDDEGGDTEEVDATQGGTLAAVQSAGTLQCGGCLLYTSDAADE